MTIHLRERGVRALVLDIEGTTTPIAFVHDVLFSFARTNLREYVRDHRRADDLRAAIGRLRAEWANERGDRPPDWPDPEPERSVESIVAYVEWLMDRDRKSPALKWLQGAIWDRGYQAGVLKGEVFADVPPALDRWRAAGIEIAIYSSGSELAQRRLFGTTPSGDLTRFISRFFDTAVGPKTSPDSYRCIARSMQRPVEQMLFVSDVAAELDAAQSAGWQVVLCVRPGHEPPAPGTEPPAPGTEHQALASSTRHLHPAPGTQHHSPSVVHRFDEIVL